MGPVATRPKPATPSPRRELVARTPIAVQLHPHDAERELSLQQQGRQDSPQNYPASRSPDGRLLDDSVLELLPTEGSCDEDGSPRDSVWKRYFAPGGALSSNEPLTYSKANSAFVSPRSSVSRQLSATQEGATFDVNGTAQRSCENAIDMSMLETRLNDRDNLSKLQGASSTSYNRYSTVSADSHCTGHANVGSGGVEILGFRERSLSRQSSAYMGPEQEPSPTMRSPAAPQLRETYPARSDYGVHIAPLVPSIGVHATENSRAPHSGSAEICGVESVDRSFGALYAEGRPHVEVKRSASTLQDIVGRYGTPPCSLPSESARTHEYERPLQTHEIVNKSSVEQGYGLCTDNADILHQGNVNLEVVPDPVVPLPMKTSPSPSTLCDPEEAIVASKVEAANAVARMELRGLHELRSFRHPAPAVSQVIEATAAILGMPEVGWVCIRPRLDATLLHRIGSFDMASVAKWPRSRAERLQKMLRQPSAGTSPRTLSVKCPAAAPFADWCIAVARLLSRLHEGLVFNGLENSPAKQAAPVPRRSTGAAAGAAAERRQRGSGGSRGETAAAGIAGQNAADIQRAAETREPPDLRGFHVDPPLWKLSEADLARVRDLHIWREGVGSVTFQGSTDCRGLLDQLCDILIIEQGEVVVYPDVSKKPRVGQGLNKPASIVLLGCMPRSQSKLADAEARERYKRRVRQMTEEKGAIFEDYDCDTGTWNFRVDHF
eukprot:TRINITY_DN23291_c0_g2_i1.p1 TRINITY_DN23291_c0_g2~~TRINITY_DN23291_c0_g2_i1.p1  ORF type:complete len:741 (+),score=88.91 TRINITY_DN23291_c0_g2_i1:61-2223(+)